jgi:hypothetical protein
LAEEKRFEEKVKYFLESRGAWFLKTWGGGFQRSGVPDLLICYKGRFIGIELKAEKGKVSELQDRELRLIRNAGGMGFILRPSHFGDLIQLIDSIDEGSL